MLENLICKNPQFAWTYAASTNNESAPHIMNKDDRSYESEQLVHAFFAEGEQKSVFFDMLFPLFYFLEDKTGFAVSGIEKIKANMLLRKDIGRDAYNTPHVDLPEPGHKSMIYYVIDSDGDTFVFNQVYDDRSLTLRKRIVPKRRKAIIFESNTWHASSNPRAHPRRVVLNFIFGVTRGLSQRQGQDPALLGHPV